VERNAARCPVLSAPRWLHLQAQREADLAADGFGIPQRIPCVRVRRLLPGVAKSDGEVVEPQENWKQRRPQWLYSQQCLEQEIAVMSLFDGQSGLLEAGLQILLGTLLATKARKIMHRHLSFSAHQECPLKIRLRFFNPFKRGLLHRALFLSA
jgi:hypothetical protein